MKTAAERGPVGAWAYDARQDADLSVEEVAERLTRIGQPVTAATLRGVESGSKKPSRRLLRAMGQVYGRPAPNEEAAAPEGTTVERLLEAQAELTRALITEQRATQALLREVLGGRRAGGDDGGGEPEDAREPLRRATAAAKKHRSHQASAAVTG